MANVNQGGRHLRINSICRENKLPQTDVLLFCLAWHSVLSALKISPNLKEPRKNVLSHLAFVLMCFHLGFDVSFMRCKNEADLFLESKALSSHYSIHCNFIMKLAERENISTLTDEAEISQISKLCSKHNLISYPFRLNFMCLHVTSKQLKEKIFKYFQIKIIFC